MSTNRVNSRRQVVVRFTTALALISTVLSLSGCPDRTPPPNVSGFTAAESDMTIDLSWVNPSSEDFAGVVVVRREDGFPSSETDGVEVFNGTSMMTSDTGLTNGTTYYYAAFTYDSEGNYSSGVQASAIPTVGLASPLIVDEFEATGEMIEMADIPDEAREQLESDFNDAESRYRSGDMCGAADALENYEDEAQALRQFASEELAGTYEELYVAGRRLRYTMVATSSAKELCPGQERVGEMAEAIVDEEHNSNTEHEVTIAFGEPVLLTVRHEGKVFTNVEIPGCDSLSGEPGAPAVPMFRRLIAVPQGAEVHVECDWEEAETIFLNVHPIQPPPVDQEFPPVPGTEPDDSVFADKPFVINDALYSVDDPFGVDPCSMTDLGELRDIRTFLIEVPAGRYSAESDSLTLLRNVHVRTTFEGGAGTFATERLNSSFESNASVYGSVFMNSRIIHDYLSQIDFLESLGEEFMILTPPQFRAAADNLATWKNNKGIVTRVFEVGVGTTIDTPDEIVDLIKDEYENSRIRPSYVLILGNTAFIPCHYIDPNGDVGAPTIGTDYPYTAFGLFGIFPQLALGRIPVRSLAHANRVVDRIIAYEDTPPVNADFYKHAAIAAQFQCCYWEAYSIGTLGTDQRTFIQCAEFARNAMRAAGKTVDRIYDQTNDPLYEYDTTPRKYRDGTHLPAELGPGSGFDWSNGATEISAAWNDGRFLILHRDHGWPGGWGNPPFDWSNADALTNGDLLPVVFSVNCASGLFDQETANGAINTMPNIPYFAERLLTNPNGGAIGVLGDTRNSPTWANSALTRGFFDAIWPNAIPDFGNSTSKRRLGDILNHGKLYLFSQGGLNGTNISWSDVADEFRMWHCIGDPTLELWTENPHGRILDSFVNVRLAGGLMLADYATEGATLTAFQRDASQVLQPLGRGTVVNGVAQFELLGTPQQGSELLIAATLDDAISETLISSVPDITPPGNVQNFQATVGNLIQVVLTWTNPTNSDFAGVRILRKTTGFPTSPTDGTIVFDGFATQFIDNTVSNNNDYFYRAFAYDTSGNFASGVSLIAEVFILIVN